MDNTTGIRRLINRRNIKKIRSTKGVLYNKKNKNIRRK